MTEDKTIIYLWGGDYINNSRLSPPPPLHYLLGIEGSCLHLSFYFSPFDQGISCFPNMYLRTQLLYFSFSSTRDGNN